MATTRDVRRAHDLLDELDARAELSQEQEKLLRSFLPELPKQKTLEEIHEEVYEKWLDVEGDLWDSDNWGTVEEFLGGLQYQLKDLIDTPATEPVLPAGMRIAEHEEYGRCVVSPKSDEENLSCRIFYVDEVYVTDSFSRYVETSSLTFIDTEPAKPAHPEFLETEADYENAPEGTIVAEDKHRPAWKPNEHWFINNNPFDNREMAGGLRPAPRRVLRWGWGE